MRGGEPLALLGPLMTISYLAVRMVSPQVRVVQLRKNPDNRCARHRRAESGGQVQGISEAEIASKMAQE